MKFNSPDVKPELLESAPFDVQGFKNLLDNLKQSKEEQKAKATPIYEDEG